MRGIKVRLYTIIFLLTISGPLWAAPFFGGFYLSDNSFNRDRFTTNHIVSFYLDQKFSNRFRLYTRLSAGINYKAEYLGGNLTPYNFTIPFNIDLLYIELRTKAENKSEGYDLFQIRLGRIPLVQGSGLFFSLNGDGFDSYFTRKNFRFRLFAVTNSLSFSPLFDFQDGSSTPIFTNWDRKRYPILANFNRAGFENGFSSDINSTDYNFFFSYSGSTDYTSAEMTRLNNLRYGAILAGRIFTGFSLEFLQLFNQDLSFHFLANIDLIPEEFVVTYPGHPGQVFNTFGGRYSSFYLSFNASGKIVRGLYYNFEAVYETGFNATYYEESAAIKYRNALINSFALTTGFTYFFKHKTRPTLALELFYAHGDGDALYINGTVANREGQDNSYRSPSSPDFSFAADIPFSNLALIRLSNTVKPFSSLKNRVFSRLSLDSQVTILFRPIIKGSSFLGEKLEYMAGQPRYESPEKAFLGSEIGLGLTWQLFSDFGFNIEGAVLIPNYLIYSKNDVIWKAGVGLNFSF